MAETVFILGAGASRHTGAPLMTNFYNAIESIRDGGRAGDYQEDFDLVVEGYKELQVVYAKANMDYSLNIEEVFASFEMGRLLERLGQFDSQKVEKLPIAMRRVIGRTIEEQIKFSYGKSRGYFPHSGYLNFAQFIKNLKNISKSDIAIITFNYDYALEYAFHAANMKYDYCLRERRAYQGIPLLKLHGSLNWGKCEECSEIIPYEFTRLERKRLTANILELDDHDVSIYLTKYLPELEHHGHNLTSDPFIVPPTWNKTEYHSTISEIWKRASAELNEAKNIFIMGYSFPLTDEFFRHLYALSVIGGPTIINPVVVNPDEAVGRRFRGILGKEVRPNYKSLQIPFEESFPRCWRILQGDNVPYPVDEIGGLDPNELRQDSRG